MPRLKSEVRIKNKKAEFQFFLIDRYTAGLVLTGSEIKSIREGKASINEAFCVFMQNELFIKNMYVAEYTHGSAFNHQPRRDRKLLLNKRELLPCPSWTCLPGEDLFGFGYCLFGAIHEKKVQEGSIFFPRHGIC